MADKNTPQPLSDDDKATLARLQAQQASYQAAQDAAARQAAADALKPTAAFVSAIRTDAIRQALQAAIDSKPDLDTMQRLLRIKQSFDYDVESLNTLVTTVNTAPAPAAS